ncbi:ImmA/IrrE family metallo-endopeptidase [Leuconostoc gelidum subsp. gelidum]|mgnify:CR=1 FL=1|uniref:ImmA/IrrE family metallo-endopeptidase n=1 Tax=Leuconostoc gelidum subsp. gelidum TaxID=1607839 RepID=A0AB35G108_LEUGE|nr:ImmA/IrrE family metallo-endopeptidase [Leuconostoc gelidum]MBZ5964636.1 ImmA/IrrE family metallo-endopeptidase [Leuconostoc gelidum subsp. gelidum]MBZ5974759.1 ImmA/IrrE family metallo-endopeptidase [Leuconostoc gelidum subsp. gelidum]MBZ5977599.1 ImmA/IrrE family metallo-endopeptidase [Leuconostoc gelidum subsp. gelidum]MBZ5986463.1 ImmA/IrrE family metallo-endopeptidase [Leuconostoc gelidum subsp. gelidum]MBZ5999310.1 ImmA/IrrE family metallo-endopeptidase [Leuconostoc gelidum subsp. gel
MSTYNSVINYLENIIQTNHITLIHISCSSYDPDVVNTQKRAIIINRNYQTHFSYHFRLAHEIAHLLTETTHTYNFSQLAKSTSEKKANLTGIKILADCYFSDHQSKIMCWERRFQFIETFGLGQLTHLVEHVLTPK